MIKIGNEKLFTMTELLENLAAYLDLEYVEEFNKTRTDIDIATIAATIGESADFVRGFVTSRREE